jgi:chromosome segregation ATPase
VEDKGLVMTLLPPEKEQQLENLTQQITDGLAAVKEVINATRGLKQAIDRLPFVNLPELDSEKITAAEETMDSLRNGVTDFKNSVRQFREETAAEISRISTAANNVGNRLATSQESLAQIDTQLGALQTAAAQLKQTIPTYVNILVVILILLLAWVSYAMVVLIQRALAQLRG